MTKQAEKPSKSGAVHRGNNGADALYTIAAYLPGRITEDRMHVLDHLFGENTLAFSCDDARHTDQWYVEWLVDFTPEWDQIRSELETRCLELALIHDRDELASLSITDVPERNWLEYSYQQFPPFVVGSFHIRGSHHRDMVPPSGYTPLIIDAATAFGSGEHGTTKGCLLLMETLINDGFVPKRILDFGTGSGILAIAAWQRWQVPVIATDHDREALRVTSQHILENTVPDDAIRCVMCDDGSDAAIAENGSYDLIMANILAGPLKQMAGDLAYQLADDGVLIISGIIQEQIASVLTAYQDCGLEEKRQQQLNGWTSFLLTKTA